MDYMNFEIKPRQRAGAFLAKQVAPDHCGAVLAGRACSYMFGVGEIAETEDARLHASIR
jgi:hypothetical protein